MYFVISALSQEPTFPSFSLAQIKQFLNEYGLVLSILFVGGIYWLWNEFRGPAPIKDSAYWAKPEHLRRAKESILTAQCSGKIDDLGYQAGNLLITDACTSIFSIGAPKTGKSFGCLNALIYEHLKQGQAQVILDLQYPVQASLFIPIAQQLGYAPEDINLFVPGEDESGTWNMTESAVGSKALAMSTMLQANFSSKDSKDDDFFTPAGRQLIAASLSLANQFPDIYGVLGCHKMLGFHDLPDRLKANRAELEGTNPWVMDRFTQYLASSGSSETASSIAGTASNLFSQFVDQEIVRCLVGKSSFPTYLDGKKLLIIGCTPRLRRVVSPLVMALLALIVEDNAVLGRKTKLQIAGDEIPAVNYPELVFHINELRKYGIFFNLAAQTITQMRSRYGEHDTESIFTGVGSTVWFNPRSNVSADYLSHILGKKIFKEHQYSRGSSGGKGNSNVSIQTRERDLFPANLIRQMPQGQAIILTREVGNANRSYVPWKLKIKPDPEYIALSKWAPTQWEYARQQLIKRSPQAPVDGALLTEARLAVEALLPSVADIEINKKIEVETQDLLDQIS
jgi:type IV secretory pathway TraG/TraD family ATPase VirD4